MQVDLYIEYSNRSLLTPCTKVMFLSIIALTVATILMELNKSSASDDPWILKSDTLPSNVDFRASVANGLMGTLVMYPYFHVNGIYNGADIDSDWARVPNPLNFEPVLNDAVHKYSLNLRDGYFLHEQLAALGKVATKFYCHRQFQTLMVKEITITNKNIDKELVIPVELSWNMTSPDITSEASDLNLRNNETATLFSFVVKTTEFHGVPSPEVSMVYINEIPEHFKIRPGPNSTEKFIFVAAVTVNDKDKATSDYEWSISQPEDALFERHQKAWHNLWESGITISGNDTIASALYSSYYYILSSMALPQSDYTWPFYGLSPGSLAHTDNKADSYWGHTFWDQEVWMLPGLTPFYPEIIKKTLNDSRIRRLPAARLKAALWGFKGAMMPWEAAYTGYDVASWLNCTRDQIHINGDVILAFQTYLFLNDDHEFVAKEGAYTLAYEVAEFWQSRTDWSEEKGCHVINDVMPPDEYHRGVNNSVYTNVIAALSLAFPAYLYKKYSPHTSSPDEPLKPPPNLWEEIASTLFIPYDHEIDYHPEYENYTVGTKVKQADAILLGFPLGLPMNQSTQRNDLTVYENVTDRDGPAMTWSMFTVNWLHVNDEKMAGELFWRSFEYIRKPFNVWTEQSNGSGATNFITGMGGFMQVFLYGYFGLRVRKDCILINPKPIRETDSYTIKKLVYKGTLWNFAFTKSGLEIHLEHADSHLKLRLTEEEAEANTVVLHSNQRITVQPKLYRISVSER